MNIKHLKRLLHIAETLLEENPALSRRGFLEVAGATALGVGAVSCTLGVLEKYHFADGPDFATHVRNARSAGKDWLTSWGTTLITAPAEGLVLDVYKSIYYDQPGIRIWHLGGRYTNCGPLTETFVRQSDYVGRYTIIGLGGGLTDTASGRLSPPHVHIGYHILKSIFGLIERKEDNIDGGRTTFLLDPEAQGQKGYGLELWKGEDFFSEHLARNKVIINYLDSLLLKAPKNWKEAVENAAKNPLVNLDAMKVIYLNRALQQNVKWLTPEEKRKLGGLMKEYANLKQPLTLPFVNPELDKIPGLYQRGGTARTLEEFTRQYASVLNMMKERSAIKLQM